MVTGLKSERSFGERTVPILGRVSVIMGIYNCEATLPQAIDSILAQTYENWELIMCDDCSMDGTAMVAQRYVDAHPDRMMLIHNERNMHLAYSLNRCLEYATGELVARMDGDDISLPERFERQVAYLKEHHEVDLVGTAMRQFNDEDGMLRTIYKPSHTDRWTLHREIPFHHATIMTYRWVYEGLGGYTVLERTNRCEDYDLWFRFFAAGLTGDNIPESFYLVREDKGAIRRRTPRVRMLAFQTTLYGYRLLGYPRRWLVVEFLVNVGKSLVPYQVQYFYRRLQGWREV